MTLHDIVKEWLEKNGYEGLYSVDADCGCKLDDLMPCGEPGMNCRAGHVVPCDPETCGADGDCPWHIGKKDCTQKGTPETPTLEEEKI